jgi:hypothetical protein
MVKTPRTRHSKSEREPVTIELGPDDVSHLAEGDTTATEQTADAVKEDIGASETAEPLAESTADATASDTPPEVSHEPETPFAEEPKQAESETFGRQAQEEPRPSTQPEPPAAPSRPSRGSALTAGIAGGVVALLAGGLLQFAGILGSPDTGGSSAPAVPAAVEAEIAALKSEIEGLKAGAGNAGDISGTVDGLSQALDQVKADVASLKQAVESGGAGGNAGIEALNTKIAELETRIDSIGPGTDGATPEEIAAINDKIAGVEALARAAGETGSALDGRLGAIEQSLSGLTAKVDSQAAQPKIALAIAASALKAAIERGAPFQPEIETFAAIAPQAPGLAELRPYAEKGVATRDDIIAETDAAANAMIAAASPPPQDASFFERLLTSAESLVSVRPIGAVEGPGVPETVARMEVALQAGDLAKAIAEFDTLPEPAKAAGATFADKIRARLTVERLADQAIAAAMQA